MKFVDQFISALRAIGTNKLRSMLTMLGVVIGVGSVIAMIGIGQGTKAQSLKNLQRMGTDMLIVWPNWRRGKVTGGPSAVPVLENQDVRTIRENVPLAKYVTGEVNGGVTASHGDETTFTKLTGAEPVERFIRNANSMYQGGWYTNKDNKLANRVCVLGYKVYKDVYGGKGNAVGTTIRINRDNFRVLGVVNYKGGSGFWNPDDQIYCPLTTAQQRVLGKKKLDSIAIQVANPHLMVYTQGQIEDALDASRSDASGQSLFNVLNQGDMIQAAQKQTQLLGILLAGIASVSLLVGGIGIMNIMLVSVTERTREIGLRKAIGAKRLSILQQFLMESVVMCSIGGVLGIILGTGGVHFVAPLMHVPAIINTQAILMAVGFSIFVGVFFGLYPAIRASKLVPIEALRFE